jgi:DNA repair protein SbcC/Rad50
VSLALALGLSDLASRNIRIDSLFIDEGFGSLDGAALEDAMVTLDKLQAESDKNIGIISHVESLKERFSVQIQLQKQSNGFSTMRIVPEMEKD